MQLHLFGIATEGGVFGHDAQQDNILFFKTIILNQTNPETALKQIESFVNQAQRWRERLSSSVSAHINPQSVVSHTTRGSDLFYK